MSGSALFFPGFVGVCSGYYLFNEPIRQLAASIEAERVENDDARDGNGTGEILGATGGGDRGQAPGDGGGKTLR